MPILTDLSYYDSVRRKLGFSGVSNEEIDDPFIKEFSELKVLSDHPGAEAETDPLRVMYVKNAVICLMAAQLCPLAASRYETEVKTIDTSWKHDKVNWAQRKLDYEAEADLMLSKVKPENESGAVKIMEVALREDPYHS